MHAGLFSTIKNSPSGHFFRSSSTRKGGLLLHLALKEKLSLEPIQLLVQAWPDAVCEHDRKGQLPLHAAFQYGCTADTIQFLAHSWSKSCIIPTGDDSVLLDLALEARMIWETIELLVKAWSEDLFTHNKEGYLPLH